MNSFDEPKMPKGLDKVARKKWEELTEMVDLGAADADVLTSYCRNHSILTRVRKTVAAREKAKQFETMIIAKNGAEIINPLITAECRLMQAGNRMLVQLGIAGNGKRQEVLRKPKSTPPPAGCSGPEPPWGWAIEEKMHSNKLADLPGAKPWKH